MVIRHTALTCLLTIHTKNHKVYQELFTTKLHTHYLLIMGHADCWVLWWLGYTIMANQSISFIVHLPVQRYVLQ